VTDAQHKRLDRRRDAAFVSDMADQVGLDWNSLGCFRQLMATKSSFFHAPFNRSTPKFQGRFHNRMKRRSNFYSARAPRNTNYTNTAPHTTNRLLRRFPLSVFRGNWNGNFNEIFSWLLLQFPGRK